MSARAVHAPRGTELSCRGWGQEAALRMLMNNLDPDVAERPDDLVVYGGTGKAARSWEAFDALVRTLRTLADDETMLVQSGKPVGVFRTHEWAPRVLIANSNLVGEWATWDEFRRLEALGLTMYGQMTAGSWIYIGSQGIVQGTYECFAEIARRRFGGSLAGTITLTAGLGGMGGAQPLAVTMNEGVALCVEVDRDRIRRRLETRYLDEEAGDLADAVERCLSAKRERRPLSVGLCANAAEVLPELLRQGFEADVVTDQTSAHDPLVGYVPANLTLAEADALRRDDPDEYIRRARVSAAAHCFAMVGFMDAGSEVFDYGNSLRAEAKLGGFERAFDYPGFVPAYIRPLFCEGKGPFRWVALSGDPDDIAATDRAVLEEFPEDESLARWIRMAGERIAFQGLPARICWLGYGERRRLGLRFNEMVASGELSAPIVIGRDHLDSGLGGLSLPRDRVDARRLRCDRRLAAPQRAGEHGLRSIVGEHPPRGRRGNRPLDPRGHGVRGRRNRARRREARPCAHGRPRHRRDAPRRRRLRARDRGCGGARRPHPDARARRVSRREIVEIGHPVLRERAREVTAEELRSDSVQGLIDDMIETMRAADGAGLAANQVGETVRVAVVEVRPGNPRYPYKPPVPLTVIVNPVIEPLDDEVVHINEGCLSVPNLRGEVPRHVSIRLRYLDRDGAEHEEVRRGLTAGTFQHELDHLDGTLFVDRVSDLSTLSTWAEFERFHRDEFVERARELVERVGS